MNFKNLLLTTFAFGLMLSASTKNNVAVSQPSNNLKSNYQKPLQTKHNLNYQKAIAHKIEGGRITTQFSPIDKKGYQIELDTLASELGYDHFNWVSYVEADPYGISDREGNMMSAPYNDPPLGGYQYDSADRLPFYWDVTECDRCKQRHNIQNYHNLQRYNLVFEDAPRDSRLQPGESIEFMTSLVGVKSINSDHTAAEWDVLYTFRWQVSNITPNNSQISLIDTDLDTAQLPPSLLAKMSLDGAKLATSVKVSSSN